MLAIGNQILIFVKAYREQLTGMLRKDGYNAYSIWKISSSFAAPTRLAFNSVRQMEQMGAVIWTPEGVLDEIRSLLEPYNPNGVEISLKTDLSSELNIDSVAAMNLVMEIEDKFELDIPINQLPDMNTPKDLVEIVLARVNK